MKANKTTILLLAALLIVWGVISFILYRYFIKPGQIATITSKPATYTKASADTFSLLLDYPNPFNTGLTTQRKVLTPETNASKVPAKEKKQAKPKVEAVTIKLQYLGLMGSVGKSSIVLVSLNGEELTLQTDEQIEGYTIKKATQDELILTKGKETKVFSRQ